MHHVGRDVARGDGVDGHVECGHLVGHGLGEADDPPLGRGVGRDSGLADRPIIDEIVTMRPQRWRRMWGAAARRALKTPVRLVSTVSDHPAASRVEDRAQGGDPGVGHHDVDRTELARPRRRRRRSWRRGRGRRPRPRHTDGPRPRPVGPSRPGRPEWRAGRSRCPGRRSGRPAAMSAPWRASSTAWLRPWPRAPPVMTATRPANCPARSCTLLRTVPP